VLIIQSRQDQAVAWNQAETLRDLIPSKDKQIVWLEDSGHVVTRDAERQRVFEVTTAFVRRVAGERP